MWNATIVLFSASLAVEEPTTQDGLSQQAQAWIEAAAELLVERQERYQADRGLGRVSDEQLKEWQPKEEQRLSDLREEHHPGVEWPYEGVYRTGRTIPDGYRVGGSAIVCEALLESPGFAESKKRQQAVLRCVDFMVESLRSRPALAAGPQRNYDVRVWAHIYAIHFFCRALEVDDLLTDERRSSVEEIIPELMSRLTQLEIERDGGWNYAARRVSSFTTASCLLALFRARAAGFPVDAAIVNRALDALEGARADNGAFAYSGRREEPMAASSARAAIGELVLYRAGRSDLDRVRVAVRGFFDNWDELLKRKSQQGTHEPPYSIAPYYFFYGHTYAGLAIEVLPEDERPQWRQRLFEVLARTREEDGGWNDRVFPRTKSYSTAMAMLALLAPQLPEVAEWTSDAE